MTFDLFTISAVVSSLGNRVNLSSLLNAGALQDIANIIGLPVEPVRVALTKLQKKKMARINKEVNKRYEERKLSERFRAEQQRKVLVQNRESDKDLDGPRHKPGKGRANGMDN